ncbi:ABC-2 type transport system ATP-binding protein [Evansella caseinilytica]|uniref:ABC-2 type transport system ATP-binding protein n=1 Tax=Evansella caseinilytica TaxID=1503961 RepID=A0A1H3R1P8_9BACI|nr:ABC transporter ATP-binding protein [Evansella caseinilytica]SDZ19221.1 ABC-2 type transport system ATP-binding protein [Evansella caseinilytica]
MNVIECSGLTKVYGSRKAVNDLSFTIAENKITGLIGRNGAGKTTLLKIIAGYYRKSAGKITVFSKNPFNNIQVAEKLIFVDDRMSFPPALALSEILSSAAAFYPHWNKRIADGLLNYFQLEPKEKHQYLSKGMASTFNMIIGLASRCPLTIYDEPTTGMDAAVRKDFYRALLKDYIEQPRTIILSSHLLNEIEDLLEDVLLLRGGSKELQLPIAELKHYAVGLSGREEAFAEFINDVDILHQKQMGNVKYIVVRNNFSESLQKRIGMSGVEMTPVATDDVCVYLTAGNKGGIDDVFHRSE